MKYPIFELDSKRNIKVELLGLKHIGRYGPKIYNFCTKVKYLVRNKEVICRVSREKVDTQLSKQYM